MGCGASTKNGPRGLTPDEQQTVCEIACREMCILTGTYAISQFEKIVIDPPDCINKFDANAAKCEQAGEAYKAQIAETTGGGAVQEAAEESAKKVGGVVGGMMKMGAAMVDKAAETTGDMAGKAINVALFSMAELQKKAVAEVRTPFTAVGKDIVGQKKEEITACFVEFINKYKFEKAPELCRVDGDTAISNKIVVEMVTPLAELLLPIVQDAINKHIITKLWQAAIDQTNTMIDYMTKHVPEMMKKNGPEKIDLNLNIYIVTEVIKAIGTWFGEKEQSCRVDPSNKSRKPKLFKAVFTKSIILNEYHLAEDYETNNDKP